MELDYNSLEDMSSERNSSSSSSDSSNSSLAELEEEMAEIQNRTTMSSLPPPEQIDFFFEFFLPGILLNGVGILGLAGNLISISILSRPQMKGSTNCILIGLASYDIILILTSILMFGLPSVFVYTRHPAFGLYFWNVFPYVTPFVYPIGLIAQTSSAYLTLCVTIERYVAVCRPLRARSLCTYGRARACVLAVGAAAIAYNVPRFFEVTWHVVFDPEAGVDRTEVTTTPLRRDPTYISVYITWLYVVVMYIVPFTCLAAFNLKIYQQIRKANAERAQLSRLQQREICLATMLMIVVLVFFACNVLALVINVMEMLGVQISQLTQVSNLLVTLNSSVNFIIYCIFGEKFKRLFCHIFCARCSGGVGEDGGGRFQLLHRSGNKITLTTTLGANGGGGGSPSGPGGRGGRGGFCGGGGGPAGRMEHTWCGVPSTSGGSGGSGSASGGEEEERGKGGGKTRVGSMGNKQSVVRSLSDTNTDECGLLHHNHRRCHFATTGGGAGDANTLGTRLVAAEVISPTPPRGSSSSSSSRRHHRHHHHHHHRHGSGNSNSCRRSNNSHSGSNLSPRRSPIEVRTPEGTVIVAASSSTTAATQLRSVNNDEKQAFCKRKQKKLHKRSQKKKQQQQDDKPAKRPAPLHAAASAAPSTTTTGGVSCTKHYCCDGGGEKSRGGSSSSSSNGGDKQQQQPESKSQQQQQQQQSQVQVAVWLSDPTYVGVVEQVKVVRVEISSSTSANHNPAEEDEEEAGGGVIWDN